MRSACHEPTAEVRAKHCATGHAQYRPWCRHCVAARRPDLPHARDAGTHERSIPEVHADFCFFRDVKGAESVPALVVKDRASRAVAAHVLHQRADYDHAARQMAQDTKRWGIQGQCVLRCDQEPVLIALCMEVARLRGEDKTIYEHNPKGDSQRAGFIEAGVKAVEGGVRSILFNLEERIGAKIPAQSAAFAWLVEHAAASITRH